MVRVKTSCVVIIAILACALFCGCSSTTQNVETNTIPALSEKNEQPNSIVVDTPTLEPTKKSSPTPAPTPTPTQVPKPTSTPKPTNIPKKEFLGTWKSCGLTTKEGTYYTVKKLEDLGNYNITDFYNILSETGAEVYIQGDIYHNVSWRTTENGIVVGTNVMTLEKGKLTWNFDNEVLWYERVSGIKSVDDIQKNPYVKATLGQKNALDKAKSYLKSSSFSYTGLIDQLEFNGFTHEEAVYAADYCGADWNEQAIKKAKSYLKSSSFSYTGLIDQLEFNGFTHEQAVNAVDKCGANWNEQAQKKAKSYLSSSSFSYTGLIDQLEFNGFTHEQAVNAVDKCGADWNEQAVKKAKSYLKSSSFSKERLISQLEYNGFTHEQAVYAVEQVGY